MPPSESPVKRYWRTSPMTPRAGPGLAYFFNANGVWSSMVREPL
jgi:hypothetical protein